MLQSLLEPRRSRLLIWHSGTGRARAGRAPPPGSWAHPGPGGRGQGARLRERPLPSSWGPPSLRQPKYSARPAAASAPAASARRTPPRARADSNACATPTCAAGARRGAVSARATAGVPRARPPEQSASRAAGSACMCLADTAMRNARSDSHQVQACDVCAACQTQAPTQTS